MSTVDLMLPPPFASEDSEHPPPPAAPDYSSLVVAAERQPLRCLPPRSHNSPCESSAACRGAETGGGDENWEETKTAARCPAVCQVLIKL